MEKLIIKIIIWYCKKRKYDFHIYKKVEQQNVPSQKLEIYTTGNVGIGV